MISAGKITDGAANQIDNPTLSSQAANGAEQTVGD